MSLPDLGWRRDADTGKLQIVPKRKLDRDLIGLLLVAGGIILLTAGMYIWLGIAAAILTVAISMIALGLLLGYSKGNK